MAGTDKKRSKASGGPVVILVEPQLGENIGMVARAMLNTGLTELRLVSPRDAWPNEKAIAAASGASLVLDEATIFDSTAAAVADLHHVFATTARARGMNKTVLDPRQAAGKLHRAVAAGERVGLLFGPERSGLTNDDLALADRAVAVPLNPGFSSLNLAQAVLILGYEWFRAGQSDPPANWNRSTSPPATKEELIGFFARLETALDEAGFLYPPEKRPTMVRNLRNLFQRSMLTEQELRTLHGIISALSKPKG